MPTEEHQLTRAGFISLEKELRKLENVDLIEIAERLTELRSETDSEGEDPELYNLLNQKGFVDERIANIKRILALAVVLDEDPNPDIANAGDRVVVYDMLEKEEIVFDLLDSAEIVQRRTGISTRSPVGRALVGKRVGDIIEVDTPNGKVRYKVLRFEEVT
ncbi:MAG: GreA/GreB family elongation factor [Phototrophicaceae bacterium]|jgi:transcription elongation factor GreA